MPATTHAPADTSPTREDRLDQLEARLQELRTILDDPLALLNRLRELELEGRAAAQ